MIKYKISHSLQGTNLDDFEDKYFINANGFDVGKITLLTSDSKLREGLEKAINKFLKSKNEASH